MNQLACKKNVNDKNIALNGFGYWPRAHSRNNLPTWILRLTLKTIATIVLITICNSVETSQQVTAGLIAKTTRDTLIEQQLVKVMSA